MGGVRRSQRGLQRPPEAGAGPLPPRESLPSLFHNKGLSSLERSSPSPTLFLQSPDSQAVPHVTGYRAGDTIRPTQTLLNYRATVGVAEEGWEGSSKPLSGWNLSLSLPCEAQSRSPGTWGSRCSWVVSVPQGQPQSSGLAAAALCPAGGCSISPCLHSGQGRDQGRCGSGSELALGLSCGLIPGPAFCGRT